ncbi:MAG: pyridoxamine 5'-phosphate oxidase [Neisseriaceae bacterium]
MMYDPEGRFRREIEMKVDLHEVRQEYTKEKLSIAECQAHPLAQFKLWFQQALKSRVRECNAMNLATVDENKRPSARMVLLKEINDKGFIFFTNYKSRKGLCIQQNPYVALTFFWPELERQVRIEGIAEVLETQLSDEYFESRPYKSQIGAWVSKQSKILTSKTALLTSFALTRARNPRQIKRPAFWGGYIVIPDRVEFWQGRPNRLHDRVEYILSGGCWKKQRLYP